MKNIDKILKEMLFICKVTRINGLSYVDKIMENSKNFIFNDCLINMLNCFEITNDCFINELFNRIFTNFDILNIDKDILDICKKYNYECDINIIKEFQNFMSNVDTKKQYIVFNNEYNIEKIDIDNLKLGD